ncbi:MarR family winged helix-turn-helix transcriptional regulator [Chitinasiproducens palmae]|uniref:DNA-binding transcriptional regulator, MarR family n=1 Tax=Chitinasiproducens palmae TaxID=1770053 RepID=A0A1H2PN54_9BURK|nr:MarR family transcriptional regulator [Chitinasiproducens palmae]SDV48060.1 DNA-binding transcriptional regulator, MarR family [Chitinasiproducens palmae]
MFDHCLYFNTSALARLVEREWGAAYAPFELTPPQGFALRVILRQPGLLHRELAEVLGIARPTATRLIDHLVAKGWVERRTAEGDRRESQLFPTQAADALRDPLEKASRTVDTRLRGQIGSAEFESTVGAMRAVRGTLA